MATSYWRVQFSNGISGRYQVWDDYSAAQSITVPTNYNHVTKITIKFPGEASGAKLVLNPTGIDAAEGEIRPLYYQLTNGQGEIKLAEAGSFDDKLGKTLTVGTAVGGYTQGETITEDTTLRAIIIKLLNLSK